MLLKVIKIYLSAAKCIKLSRDIIGVYLLTIWPYCILYTKFYEFFKSWDTSPYRLGTNGIPWLIFYVSI